MSKEPEIGEEASQLLDAVQEFCMSSGFESEFEEWAEANIDVFIDVIESKCEDDYPHEVHATYQQYLSKFEARIEAFIEEQGSSSTAFSDICKSVMASNDPRKFFVQAMLATAEFDVFMGLMKTEAHSVRRKRQEQQGGGGGGDGEDPASTSGK